MEPTLPWAGYAGPETVSTAGSGRAPRSDREPGFEAEELGLVELAVDTRGPLVFVNPDPGSEPLRLLSESEQLVAHFQRLCAEALSG